MQSIVDCRCCLAEGSLRILKVPNYDTFYFFQLKERYYKNSIITSKFAQDSELPYKSSAVQIFHVLFGII